MNKIKRFYNNIPHLLKNKYFIAILLFSIWITFISDDNLILLNKNINIYNEKSQEKERLLEETKYLKDRLERLNNDISELENMQDENLEGQLDLQGAGGGQILAAQNNVQATNSSSSQMIVNHTPPSSASIKLAAYSAYAN